MAGEPIAGIISVDDLREEYLAVIADDDPRVALLQDENGRDLISVKAIESAIRRNADLVGLLLETTLTTKRYACRPDLGDPPLVLDDDYDIEDDTYPWLGGDRTTLRGGKVVLRHVPVVRVTRIRILHGTQVLWHVPVEWAQLQHRSGTIEFVVSGTGTLEQREQVVVVGAHLGNALGAGRLGFNRGAVPAYWAVDYEAGLSRLPEAVKAAIAWRAAAELLTLAAVKANKIGVTSQNQSVDGLSRSQSVADSQPGGRFSRLLGAEPIKSWLGDDRVRQLKPLVRSSIRVL